jgi:serine/threonine protein kinase
LFGVCWYVSVGFFRCFQPDLEGQESEQAAANLCAAGSHIKVADFGVAQIMDDGRDWWKQTYKMRLPGRWLAPECVRKQRYSAASDVWAFGILLWEMTSGGKQP